MSARELPEMTNEYRLTKIRESKLFTNQKNLPARSIPFEEKETASMTHTTKSMIGGTP